MRLKPLGGKEFEEEEVKEALFNMSGEKASGRFWSDLKEEVMDFIKEFHARGKLSKNLCASFIALIPKIEGAGQLKDFRSISLIGSTYKILAKLLACRL